MPRDAKLGFVESKPRDQKFRLGLDAELAALQRFLTGKGRET